MWQFLYKTKPKRNEKKKTSQKVSYKNIKSSFYSSEPNTENSSSIYSQIEYHFARKGNKHNDVDINYVQKLC
jgi:hypothetical protein